MTATKGTPPAQSTAEQVPTSEEEGPTSSNMGLAELAGSMAAEAAQRLSEVVQRCQAYIQRGCDRVDGTRSKSPLSPKKGTPTPVPHRYALEAWVTMKTDSEGKKNNPKALPHPR